MPTRPSTSQLAGSVLVGLLCLAASACSSWGAEPTGRLDAQTGQETPTCLAHQDVRPNGDYRGGPDGDTGPVLQMLRYYTAHGDKLYCDSQPATEADKAWARRYVELGGGPDRVRRILH